MCLREVGFHLVLLRLPLFNIHLAEPARDPSEGLTLLTESEGKRMGWGVMASSLSFALYRTDFPGLQAQVLFWLSQFAQE